MGRQYLERDGEMAPVAAVLAEALPLAHRPTRPAVEVVPAPGEPLPVPLDLNSRLFFVIQWDRDERTYTLVLRNGSTFNLGEGPEALQVLTRRLGDELFAANCLDVARNFLFAECVPSRKEAYVCERLLKTLPFSSPKPVSIPINWR